MTYYTLLIYVSLVIFDLLILNLVWRALTGPTRLTELSAAVVSFAFIGVAVVITFTALTTTVEAAKLTKAIPGGHYLSHTSKSMNYQRSRCSSFKPCAKNRYGKRKHGYGARRSVKRPAYNPMRKR